MKNKLRFIVIAMLGLLILTIGFETFLANTFCYAQQIDTTKRKEALPVKIRHVKDKKIEAATRAKKSPEEMNKELIEEDIKYYSPKVPSIIETLLNNSNPDSRSLAAEALAKARDLRAMQPLIKVLKNDSVATIRADAAWALGEISIYNNDFSAMPALKEALTDYSIGVKLVAARSLIYLNDRISPISALFKIFKKEDELFNEPLEFWIQKEICRPDLPESEQYSLAKHAASHKQEFALKLLIEIGNEEVIIALTDCRNSNDAWIQQKAQAAIKKIKNKQAKNRRY